MSDHTESALIVTPDGIPAGWHITLTPDGKTPMLARNPVEEPGQIVVRLAITVEADDEREAWKIIDRVLNRPDDDEILTYTEAV